MSVVNNFGRSERLPVAVEVNGCRPEATELGEELVDVGFGDAVVQVGDEELCRPVRCGNPSSRRSSTELRL